MSKKNITAYDLNRFFAHFNLNMHIRYYNEHKRLVSNQIIEITQELGRGDVDPKCKRNLVATKHEYLNSYHQHMIINAFLIMYSHFEECLAVTLRVLVKGHSVSKKPGLDRFKGEYRERCAINLADGPSWAFLQDCSEIRNTLLHAAGNITLVRDRRILDPVIKRNAQYVDVENKRLVLYEQILVDFSNVIIGFSNWLTDAIEKQHNQALNSTGDSRDGSPGP
jgi:hypothetical protein